MVSPYSPSLFPTRRTVWRILHLLGAGGWQAGARQGTHRGVGVAVLAAADVDLVLRGLLVHGVVKVDAVDALQPPVLPEEKGPEAQEGEQHWGDRRQASLPARPAPRGRNSCLQLLAFSLVNGFVLI